MNKTTDKLCNYMAACRNAPASFFAEFDGIEDAAYTAETGNKFYGWWGYICPDCLEAAKALVQAHEHGALRYVSVEQVKREQIGNGWADNQPDWSQAETLGDQSIFRPACGHCGQPVAEGFNVGDQWFRTDCPDDGCPYCGGVHALCSDCGDRRVACDGHGRPHVICEACLAAELNARCEEVGALGVEVVIARAADVGKG